MKPGDEIICPKCRQNSFLVKKNKIEGWTKTGEYLACSACSFLIEEINEPSPSGQIPHASKNLDELKSFLDTDNNTVDPQKILNSDKNATTYFCRDCKFFISHPFLNRCDLHDKNVNPMDDCPDFRRQDNEITVF